MVNNIPVNGWPQLKDLEAVQPTLDRLDKIEAWKRTVKEETFTGDDITIENALALPARSLITEINAIQEGEGDPSPTNIRPISGRTAAVITRSDGDEISEDFTIQLGATVYGAEINWDTGVASITHVLLVNNTVDMDNSEDWPGWRTSGIRQYIGGGINRVFTGQTMNVGTVYGANTTGNDDTLILPKDTYNLSQTEWKALSTDVQIIAPLATHTTIQLTPTQLEILKGYNHITLSDGYGTIELKALTGANWS